MWPGREELMKTMPEGFKREFSRCFCIIDCFEVFCERPSDLMARHILTISITTPLHF